MVITGVSGIDELLSPVKREWIVEIYGDMRLVSWVAHFAMVYRSRDSPVYVVLNSEFGGLDTSLVVKLCRIYSCDMENIMISRAFSLRDTLSILSELGSLKDAVILLLFPYSYLPPDPSKYTEATRITGMITRILGENQVLVFNTFTRFGKRRPEGGSFHHHAVKVIARIFETQGNIAVKLVKHPVKEAGLIRLIPVKGAVGVSQRRVGLLAWASASSANKRLTASQTPGLNEGLRSPHAP